MGRPERPLDTAQGPLAAFAHDLRKLRREAGNLSYRELARTACFAPSVLSTAASGHRLPTLPVTLAFVAACGGDRAAWERRWRMVAMHVGYAAEPSDPSRATAAPHPVPAVPRVPMPRAAGDDRPRPQQLPPGAYVFVGRTAELAAALRIVTCPGPVRGPLVITGPIGVGKTALALRLADDVSGEFPDGALYADLSGYAGDGDTAGEVMSGFLRALGVAVPEDPVARAGSYRSLLAQHRLFVLLEHVRDEGQVRPLLSRTAHSQVVVTSRARLFGLEGAHRIGLATFSRAQSLGLIGLLAGTDRVTQEPRTAHALAELCGDLPLAVNILGRRIAARPEWRLAHLAELVAACPLDGLRIGDVDVRERFAAAYRTLSPAARRALDHVGHADADAANAVDLAEALGLPFGQADELLEALVDAGLLTRTPATDGYGVPPLARAFAADVRHRTGPITLARPEVPRPRAALEAARRAAGRPVPVSG